MYIRQSLLICFTLALATLYIATTTWNNEYPFIYGKMDKQCPPEEFLTDINDFFNYLAKMETSCEKKFQVGGVHIFKTNEMDGDKWLCLDERFRINPRDCLVYSFGINDEWSFDDAMAKFGCKVYSLDPSMSKPDHQRSPNVQFLNLGISNFTGTKIVKNKTWAMDRYENIVVRLGLENSDVDYIKMDVEGSELDWFQDMFDNSPPLLQRIKQIGMEIHPGKYTNDTSISSASLFGRYWSFFQRLQCHGFKLMFSFLNKYPGNSYTYGGNTQACCYELVWVQEDGTWV